MKIHPTALVHPGAELDEGVEIGPFTTVGEHVRIGRGTVVMSSVVLDGWTTLGCDNVVFPGAVIGVAPQDLRYRGQRSYVRIGDRNQLREFVTIHRAADEEGHTTVGSDNLLMGYVHVAHNCEIGNQVVIANYAGMAGHAIIEDQATLGGMCGVHQFARIGRLSMVGGLSKVTKDVPPFTIVDGQPVRIYGLNFRGLQRRGVGREARMALKRALRLLTSSGLNVGRAAEAIQEMGTPFPEVQHLVGFLKAPSRMGVLNRRAGSAAAPPGPSPEPEPAEV